MTTFFADLRVYANPKHEDTTVSVEVPAADLPQALAILMAFKAGLSAHPDFDTAMEESLAASKTRGRQYLTMREAASFLRDTVFM
jgi:hypothetical protein